MLLARATRTSGFLVRPNFRFRVTQSCVSFYLPFGLTTLPPQQRVGTPCLLSISAKSSGRWRQPPSGITTTDDAVQKLVTDARTIAMTLLDWFCTGSVQAYAQLRYQYRTGEEGCTSHVHSSSHNLTAITCDYGQGVGWRLPSCQLLMICTNHGRSLQRGVGIPMARVQVVF